MQRRAKSALWIGALLAVAAAGAWWQRAPITVALMTRQVNAMTAAADPLAALPDGLHVGLCGAGSPFPDDQRSGPCTAVVAGRRLFIFDSGSGAGRNIARMRLNAGQIEALFLTHYHSDHIDGLGPLGERGCGFCGLRLRQGRGENSQRKGRHERQKRLPASGQCPGGRIRWSGLQIRHVNRLAVGGFGSPPRC